MAGVNDLMQLRDTLMQLFENMQQMRQQLASIRHPGASSDRIGNMAEQLDAIVGDTEEATNTILHSAEEMERLGEEIRARSDDPEIASRVDQLGDLGAELFQACAFQDITGQRITKVVTSLKFIEERVNTLVEIWGRDHIASEPVVEHDEDETDKRPDKNLLNGPQIKGNGISQDDIDALFD